MPESLKEKLITLSDKLAQEVYPLLNIAYGSLKEAKYLLYFAYKQNLIEEKDYLSVKPKTEELSKLLYVFMKKLSS